MELCQLVCCSHRILYVVLLQELAEHLLSLLLQFTAVTTQDGLNLGLGLCGAHEVDPGGVDMLRLGCQDFHLVATLQFVAQRY